jgi:hypothetical protein
VEFFFNNFLVKKKLNLPSPKIAATITDRNKISRTQNAAGMKKFNLRPKEQLQSPIRCLKLTLNPPLHTALPPSPLTKSVKRFP